jgi:hypothetical protein
MNKIALTYDDIQLVPDYSEIESRKNITLETNLCTRDAYHIYHNASPDIIIKFQNNYVKFPSFY